MKSCKKETKKEKWPAEAKESQRDRSQSAKNKSQSLHLLYRTRPEDCLVSSSEEDDATVLPSNQLANQADQRSTSATNVVETPHGSRNLPQQGQEEDEFLTQFIGSPASSNRATQTDNNVNTANLEAANFRFITICFYLIHNLITITGPSIWRILKSWTEPKRTSQPSTKLK